MQELMTVEDFEKLADEGKAVIFKHSTMCPISAAAHDEIGEFSSSHPDVPVYLVHVIENREVSNRVAQRFGITHESPQALVIGEGEIIWHGSHFDVTAEALREWVL